MTLTITRVPWADPEAQRLVAMVQAEYVERYGSPDESPIVAEAFDAPDGAFFLGHWDGDPVATGAWRRSDVAALGVSRTAEIKRMYVVPERRGAGLARQMLAHLERSAAAAGFQALVLETGTRQPEAIALYESSGYVEVPGFGHYAGSPLSRCFAKLLR